MKKEKKNDMGEIADAMLSGELCAMCGVPLCDDCAEMDIPMYCSKECASGQLVPKRDIGSRICENQEEK